MRVKDSCLSKPSVAIWAMDTVEHRKAFARGFIAPRSSGSFRRSSWLPHRALLYRHEVMRDLESAALLSHRHCRSLSCRLNWPTSRRSPVVIRYKSKTHDERSDREAFRTSQLDVFGIVGAPVPPRLHRAPSRHRCDDQLPPLDPEQAAALYIQSVNSWP